MTLIYGASASNGYKRVIANIRCHDESWWHGICIIPSFSFKGSGYIHSQYKRKRHGLVSCIIVHIELKASNDCGSYGAVNNVNINAIIAY